MKTRHALVAFAAALFACAIPSQIMAAPPAAALAAPAEASTQPATRRIGRYGVGRQTFAFVDFDRDFRLLVMDAWYPVDLADASDAGVSFYDLVFTTLDSEVSLAGPAVSSDGPFPLLVFSHGNLGIRFQSFSLMEALASRGFIVVAVDHAGNTAQDLVFDTLEPFEDSAVNRPQDVSFVIDTMLDRNATANDPFFARIDADRIGVFGHSFGGYTTMAAVSGIDGVAADTRIKAIAPFAPASGLLTDAQLQAITVPALILGGTADITTPVDPQSSRPFEIINAADRFRIDLIDAGHQSFTDICDFTDALLGVGVDPAFAAFLLGNADEGCAPDLMPIGEAQRLTALFMVAFFKAFLAGEPAYARLLTNEFVAGAGLPVVFYVAE